MRTAIALAFVLTTGTAQAETCTPLDAVLKSAPKFEDYAALPWKGSPAQPRVGASREARQYRTALREAAKAGVNFAGRYTIAGWGCGTGCLDWGTIDAANGKVRFDAARRTVENLTDVWPINETVTKHYAALGANGGGFDTLLFRRDSALLVILGAPGGEESESGIHWYRFTGTRFEQVRFVAASAICHQD